jgi:hypothetical protein
MNKSRLFCAVRVSAISFFLIIIYPQSASAVLVNGAVLDFGPAPGSPNSSQPALGTGSWVAIEPSAFSTYVSLTSHDGIHTGIIQPASGSHAGPPNGSESPSIDEPHDWFGATGMLGSNSPMNVLSATGNTAILDFTGLEWDWNGVDNIRLYDASFGDTGIATITCTVDCSNGDTYVLDYTGHIRDGDGGLGGEEVLVHLEGTISAVPIPPALWLFGSGLLGLVGIARKKAT